MEIKMTTTDTPRTDAVQFQKKPISLSIENEMLRALSREIERELTASKAEVERFRSQLERAVEIARGFCGCGCGGDYGLCNFCADQFSELDQLKATRTDSGYSQPAPDCPLCQNNTMVWETTHGWKCNRAGCHTIISRNAADAKVERLKRPYGCKCQTLRERALGDGCDECNKALVIEMLTDERDELEAEVERLKELVNESISEKSNLSIALVNCQANLRRAIDVARMLPVIPIPAISSRDITDTLYAELNQLYINTTIQK